MTGSAVFGIHLGRRIHALLGMVGAFALVCLVAWPLAAASWEIEPLDSVGGGRFTSLKLDSQGNAHVVHLRAGTNELKYSFWDQKLKKWFTATVDRSAGFCSLAVDLQDRPHISYLDYKTGKLKYAHWDGAAWKTEVIQIPAREIAFYTSITVDIDAHPTIAYYEILDAVGHTASRLRTVSFNGKVWELKTVDAAPGSGKFNSIASDARGLASIAYANVKRENTSLRFARWNGRVWAPEIIEGQGDASYFASSVSLAVGSDDISHVTYDDVPRRAVKYATRRGEEWKIEVVDSLMGVADGDRNGIALDAGGNPYISYYDAGSGTLKVAHKTDRGWTPEIVDQNFAGLNNSLQIGHGILWVTYADATGEALVVARRRLEDSELTGGGTESRALPIR